METLLLPHPLPPTDLVAKLTNGVMNDAQFDHVDFLSDFPPTDYAFHWSSLSPVELKNYLNLVRAASQRNTEHIAPASRTNLVGPYERDVLESVLCNDDPSDAFEIYHSLCFSLRN